MHRLVPATTRLLYYSRARKTQLVGSAHLAEHKEHYMTKRMVLPLCAVFVFLLAACATTETNTNNTAPSTATSTATPAAAAPIGDKIGVAECDDFIAAYDACVTGKVPEAARAQYKATIEQWRTSWKKLAENPQTRSSLAAACRQSAEQARAQMKTFDCTF